MHGMLSNFALGNYGMGQNLVKLLFTSNKLRFNASSVDVNNTNSIQHRLSLTTFCNLFIKHCVRKFSAEEFVEMQKPLFRSYVLMKLGESII